VLNVRMYAACVDSFSRKFRLCDLCASQIPLRLNAFWLRRNRAAPSVLEKRPLPCAFPIWFPKLAKRFGNPTRTAKLRFRGLKNRNLKMRNNVEGDSNEHFPIRAIREPSGAR